MSNIILTTTPQQQNMIAATSIPIQTNGNSTGGGSSGGTNSTNTTTPNSTTSSSSVSTSHLILNNNNTSPPIQQFHNGASLNPHHPHHSIHHPHHPHIANTHQLQLSPTPNATTTTAFHSPTSYKDTRWLTLEVCREYQRNKCNRNENECKFAHPPPHVEIVNGKVIACYDSLKSKCTRKDPPCKYLHPPQHLKDQLLQNGKTNLLLKQVGYAMMQQHQQQNAALLAAATSNPFQPAYQSPANTAIYNSISALPNGAIIRNTYPHQMQLTTTNGQPTLVPIVTNGFHATGLQAIPQAIYATDPALLQHVTTTQHTGQQTVNGLLPHQRTDRLTQYSQQLNTAFITNQNDETVTLNGTTYTIDGNGAYQIPQYQIITTAAPLYQQQQQQQQQHSPQIQQQTNQTQSTTNPNVNNTNNNVNSSPNNTSNTNSNTTSNNTTIINQKVEEALLNHQANADLTKAAASTVSATANATANVVDVVVPNKKRQHDATEDYIPLLQTTMYSNQIPLKRTALADNKTGMPVYQPYHHAAHHPQIPTQYTNIATAAATHQQAPGAAAIAGYPGAPAHFTMQYTPFQTFTIPYNGNPAGMPRL